MICLAENPRLLLIFFKLVDLLKEYLPIVTGLLSVIKTSYDLATPKATYKPPSADELADAVISKLANAQKPDRQQVVKAAHGTLEVWNEKLKD